MIEKITKVINQDDLKIVVYRDEVIFYIWEIEVPIVLDRASGSVFLKSEYITTDFQLDEEMTKEIMDVIRVISENKKEILKW